MILARFTDCMIDLYGMTAVLARASRSISIGLPNNEDEVREPNCSTAVWNIDVERSCLNMPEQSMAPADHFFLTNLYFGFLALFRVVVRF